MGKFKDDMRIFKDEIHDILQHHGKVKDDVLFVTDDKVYCRFDEFLNLIKDYEYDSGYGVPYIYYKLKIVGKDWWMERHEYDGAECWEFKTIPTKPCIESNNIRWTDQTTMTMCLNKKLKKNS